MKALFLTLLLCYSCTKYSPVSKDAVGVHVSEIQMPIHHLNEIEWRVGQKKEEVISQSVTFIVDLPNIKDDDLKFLTEQKSVNAWILRIVSQKGSEKQDLGSLYSLFQGRQKTRGGGGGSAPSSVSVKIYYAAAFASERFRTFKCPAFSHNRKITKLAISGVDEQFDMSIGQSFPYQEKSQLVELNPSSFNAGHTMVGEYYIEIAPYDSITKTIHAPFKRIPQFITISQEEQIHVKSCEGIHPEIQL